MWLKNKIVFKKFILPFDWYSLETIFKSKGKYKIILPIFFIRENKFQTKWDFVLNLLISLIILKNNLKLKKIHNKYKKKYSIN